MNSYPRRTSYGFSLKYGSVPAPNGHNGNMDAQTDGKNFINDKKDKTCNVTIHMFLTNVK